MAYLAHLAIAVFAPLVQATVSVVDDHKKTVVLKAPATRIVTLAPHLTELIFAVGAGKALVGTSNSCDYPPRAKQIPRVSDHQSINYELVISINPDLILAWGGATKISAIARLKEMGYPVYISEPSDFARIADNLNAIGVLTGHTAQAVKQSRIFLQQLAKLRRSDSKPLEVFYLLWHSPIITVNRNNWISKIIEHCGGSNFYHGTIPAAPIINREVLLNATIDLVIHSLDTLDKKTVNTLFGYAIPTAYIPPDLLQRPSLRLVEGAKQVCAEIQQARSELEESQTKRANNTGAKAQPIRSKLEANR